MRASALALTALLTAPAAGQGVAISGCMCSFDIDASIIDIDAYDRVHFDDGRIARLVGVTNLNAERLLEHFAPF